MGVLANLHLQQAIRRLLSDGMRRRRMDIWVSLGGSPRVIKATLRQMADELESDEQDGVTWYRLKQPSEVSS